MLLTSLFFVVALIYSIAGFGGGSSYIALLALFNTPYHSIPIIALTCNIIVVSGGCFHFIRKKQLKWSLFWPLAISSIPMAFIGGSIPVSREVFIHILGLSLLLVSIKLLVIDRITQNRYTRDNLKTPTITGLLSLGGILGLLSGMIGIGGGIFLSPILLLLRWGMPKQIAASASLFILVNSISGLMGQLLKSGISIISLDKWELYLAVLVGGQIGSWLGSGIFLPQRAIKDCTALIVFTVAVRLLYI